VGGKGGKNKGGKGVKGGAKKTQRFFFQVGKGGKQKRGGPAISRGKQKHHKINKQTRGGLKTKKKKKQGSIYTNTRRPAKPGREESPNMKKKNRPPGGAGPQNKPRNPFSGDPLGQGRPGKKK